MDRGNYSPIFLIIIGFFLSSFEVSAATISGKASFKETPPPPQKIRMDADPTCAHLHPAEVLHQDVVVDANGGLKDIFIYIKKGLEGKKIDPPREPFLLDQQGCQYSPHLFGIQTGQPLHIVNSDSTLHNVHALAKKNPEFNLGMPLKGMKLEKSFPSPEVMIKFKCEVHPWMASYVGVLDHPFFSVSGADGAFRIEGLPDGEYEVEAWHERLGTLTQKIRVTGEEVKTLEFAFETTPSKETPAASTTATGPVPQQTREAVHSSDLQAALERDRQVINAYQRPKRWWLPDAASSYAPNLDFIFHLILYITGAVFFGVQFLLFYFIIRYRKKEGARAIYYHGNNRLEVIWTIIPALILIYLVVVSQKSFMEVKGPPPEGAMPVEILAEQFAWNIKYPGPDGVLGTQDDLLKVNQLHVPVGKPVRVKLTSISKDGKHPVIHSFFVPEFRIKQDVVPGLPTEIWFEATKPGRFEIACAELCGLGHYRMRGFLTVHTQEGFDAWLKQETINAR